LADRAARPCGPSGPVTPTSGSFQRIAFSWPRIKIVKLRESPRTHLRTTNPCAKPSFNHTILRAFLRGEDHSSPTFPNVERTARLSPPRRTRSRFTPYSLPLGLFHLIVQPPQRIAARSAGELSCTNFRGDACGANLPLLPRRQEESHDRHRIPGGRISTTSGI